MQLLVRGTQMHFDGLKLAVSKLVELFTGEIYGVRPVVLNLDIGPQLHSTLIGKEGGNIRKIMDATDTRYVWHTWFLIVLFVYNCGKIYDLFMLVWLGIRLLG